jgi:hypothetical protein
MPELLEFLFNAVVELIGCTAETWAGWRFFVCFFVSLGIAMLVELLCKSGTRDVLASVVTCAGTVGGFIWEIRNKNLG